MLPFADEHDAARAADRGDSPYEVWCMAPRELPFASFTDHVDACRFAEELNREIGAEVMEVRALGFDAPDQAHAEYWLHLAALAERAGDHEEAAYIRSECVPHARALPALPATMEG